jgi:hypothetical protein
VAHKDICRTCDSIFPEGDIFEIETCYECGEDLCIECKDTLHKDCEREDD